LKWLFFMLQMLGLDALNKHAAVPGLNRNDAYEKELIVPSSNEQRRIAAVLEKADALRRLRQESLQLTEKLLQSVFIDMFGDPVRNSKHLPTKELCQLAKLERGKFTPRPRNDPSYYNGQYPFIQTGDITRSKGRITSWTQTLNDKGAAVSKEFTPGTVVIAIVGATIGETAIVETPVYCPDSIIGITPFKHKATPEFIEFLLRQWKPRLKQMAPDAARANLNLERLRPLPALSPSIEEQEEFSRIARMLRSHLLVQQESEMQLSYLFSSLQQRAFRGDLDLSRVRLDSQAEIPTASDSEVSASQSARPEGKAFLIAPGALENELERLATLIRQDGPMPWSADYFKYRVLGIMPTPFSFDDLMQRVSGVFSEEPPYEEIKDIILELLGQGGGAPLIRQRFGTSTIEETTKAHDYKQIVLEPIA
jgi:type I restriction enzyme S subunit